MAYKSLFTVLTDTDLIPGTIEQAAVFARKYDAHFEAMCMGVDRSQTGYYYAGANALVLQETLTRSHEEAAEIEAEAQRLLAAQDLRWSTESGVAQLADIGRHVGAHARFSDLAILPQPYGEGRGAELEPVLEAAMFEGRVPVLVMPKDQPALQAPKNVMICWNESPEALSAVRAALPLLKEAEALRVVVIDPPAHGPHRSDPGGLLSQFLSRHGLRPEIAVLSKTLPRVADVILRHATDTKTDLVVMGAYGHSRFREAILGGATRDMLELSDIPVFMAH